MQVITVKNWITAFTVIENISTLHKLGVGIKISEKSIKILSNILQLINKTIFCIHSNYFDIGQISWEYLWEHFLNIDTLTMKLKNSTPSLRLMSLSVTVKNKVVRMLACNLPKSVQKILASTKIPKTDVIKCFKLYKHMTLPVVNVFKIRNTIEFYEHKFEASKVNSQVNIRINEYI